MEDQDLAELMRWGAKVGISDAPSGSPPVSSCLGYTLSVSKFPEAGGRGLAAARELRKGEMILRVARGALMCRDSVLKGDNCLTASAERYPNLSPTQVLAVCLLSEVCKGVTSHWYPYLVRLPRTYDLLASFGQFEVQAFQVDDAFSASKKSISKVQYEWKEAKGLMQDISLQPQFLTFGSWLWAFSTISSRTLHIPWDEAGCLCPVGDLFNYDASDIDTPTVEHEEVNEDSNRLTDGGYEEDVDAYCFYARQRYRQGEQVLLCYGAYSNIELLEHYGFLLRNNPNDKVSVPYQRGNLSWTQDALHIQSDGKPSFALLCAVRLSIIPPNQRKAVGHLAHAGFMLSVENEIAAMKILSKTCQDLLDKLPSSIEEDGLLLEVIENIHHGSFSTDMHSESIFVAGQLDAFLQVHGLEKENMLVLPWPRRAERSLGRWKLAVRWRLGYKEILSGCIKFCTETLERLALDFKRPAS